MTLEVDQHEQRQPTGAQRVCPAELGQVDDSGALEHQGGQFSSRRVPANMPPPVAIRSSINTSRAPALTASACIATEALPYSSL